MTKPFPDSGPFQFEATNLRVKFRRSRVGYIHLLELEIDEPTWQAFKSAPEEARYTLVAWIVDDLDQPVIETGGVDPKPEKGPFGSIAQHVIRTGLIHHPALKAYFKLPQTANIEEVKLQLRAYFQVESLSQAEPSIWLHLFEQLGLAGRLPHVVEQAINPA